MNQRIIRDKLFSLIHKAKGGFGERRTYKCNCGGIITIWLNKYDNSNSGQGSCYECGARIYIN